MAIRTSYLLKRVLNSYIELKMKNRHREATLSDTVQAALQQIEEKRYDEELKTLGFKEEQIRKYGFAFEGKEVLIGEPTL